MVDGRALGWSMVTPWDGRRSVGRSIYCPKEVRSTTPSRSQAVAARSHRLASGWLVGRSVCRSVARWKDRWSRGDQLHQWHGCNDGARREGRFGRWSVQRGCYEMKISAQRALLRRWSAQRGCMVRERALLQRCSAQLNFSPTGYSDDNVGRTRHVFGRERIRMSIDRLSNRGG